MGNRFSITIMKSPHSKLFISSVFCVLNMTPVLESLSQYCVFNRLGFHLHVKRFCELKKKTKKRYDKLVWRNAYGKANNIILI